jgi:transcriptional regulator with XRE-family HTH domain
MIMGNSERPVLIRNRTLKTERKRRGWTQESLARAIGVTIRTVIRWENGITLPHPSHRVQLETLFGRTADELGLLWDIHENQANVLAPTTSLLATHQAMLEAAYQESLSVDMAIQQTLGTSDNLLGRTELIMHVKERLLDANSLSRTALYGLPGVGKTTLAVALATDKQVQAHFRDGILWAPLGPQPYILGQLMRWGALLGVTASDVENPESPLAWEQALRTATGNRRMLLIIDDAWTVEDALALQVGGPQCTYLLITRQSQVARAFAKQHAIVVPQLEEADGLALLAHHVPQLIQQDPQGAQSLVQTLGCLPLALTLMGKCLASSTSTPFPWHLRVALTRLHDTQDHLRLSMPTSTGRRLLHFGIMCPFSLYSAIAMCIQQLSQDALATLHALAVFPPKPHSFSEEAALAISRRQSKKMLDELCNTGILERWGPKRYSLHQAVAHYTRTLAKSQSPQE